MNEIKLLIRAPLFVAGYLFAVLLAIFSDEEVFGVAFAGVLLGFAIGPLLAAPIAFALYTILRVQTQLVRTKNEQTNFLARCIRDHK